MYTEKRFSGAATPLDVAIAAEAAALKNERYAKPVEYGVTLERPPSKELGIGIDIDASEGMLITSIPRSSMIPLFLGDRIMEVNGIRNL